MAVDIIGVTLILDNKKIEMHMNFEVNNLSTIFSFCAIFSLFPFFKYKIYIYIFIIYILMSQLPMQVECDVSHGSIH